MEAFNECLINTISVLLQPGEIPNSRKTTRTCREFRSLLANVTGDNHLNQWGAQTEQSLQAQPHLGDFTTSGPSISSRHQKLIFPCPLGKYTSFLTSLYFSFPRACSSHVPWHVLAAQPCLVLSHVCPMGLISCLHCNGSFGWLLNGM